MKIIKIIKEMKIMIKIMKMSNIIFFHNFIQIINTKRYLIYKLKRLINIYLNYLYK